MRSERRGELFIAAAALALAVALPYAAAAHLAARIDGGLEPALTEALGEQVSIGRVEAGLTGELRLHHVRVGRVLAARCIEASVALQSLLAGQLDADEIRIEGPRLLARVDADGGSNLARMIERMARRRADRSARPPAPARTPRQRRIVVTGGDLIVDMDGWGRVELADVALHPQAGGVRAVAGATRLDVRRGPWRVRGRLERAAADLTLPSLAAPRLLAVSGDLEVSAGDAPPVRVTRASAGRGIGDPTLILHGHLAGGAPRAAVAVHVTPAPSGLAIRVEGEDVPLAPLAPLLPPGVNVAGAHGSGRLEATLSAGLTRADLDLDAGVRDLVIEDPRVASSAVVVTGHARARAATHIDEDGTRHLRAHELRLSLGELVLEADGHASYGQAAGSWIPERGEVALRVPPLACARALGALPEALRDRLVGLDMTGTLAVDARLAFSRADTAKTRLTLDVDVARCQVLRDALAADPRTLVQTVEHTFADGSRARVGAAAPGHVALARLPAHTIRAFVSAEDGRFFRHRGFDPRQIERSLAIDLRDGAFVRGGSTISQQLVKNAFLSHERTVARKLQEAVLTWRIEAVLSKNQILERYLNIIELGPGIFGVGAAARHWFGKDAAALGVRESAFLAALTRAPRTLSRRIAERRGIDDDMRRRIDVVLRAMRRDGAIAEPVYRRALGERIALRGNLFAAD